MEIYRSIAKVFPNWDAETPISSNWSSTNMTKAEVSMFKEKLFIKVTMARNIWNRYCFEKKIKYNNQIKYKETKSKVGDIGQFGYYINEYIYPLWHFIKDQKITHMCDFGCGPGIILDILSGCHGIDYSGFDNEPDYIKASKIFCSPDVKIQLQDICTVTEEQMKGIQLIYFWEPFSRGEEAEKLSEAMVSNLAKVLEPGVLIYHKVSGDCIQHAFLDHEDQFDCYKAKGSIGVNIYKKK